MAFIATTSWPMGVVVTWSCVVLVGLSAPSLPGGIKRGMRGRPSKHLDACRGSGGGESDQSRLALSPAHTVSAALHMATEQVPTHAHSRCLLRARYDHTPTIVTILSIILLWDEPRHPLQRLALPGLGAVEGRSALRSLDDGRRAPVPRHCSTARSASLGDCRPV